MAVKYRDGNMLLTLIKVECNYIIAKRNMDFICTYVSVDQDDTSAKKLYQSFKN